jgi:adenylate cyclase
MSRKKYDPNMVVDPDLVWGEWFATDAFSVDKDLRRVFRLLPHDPRCKFCNAPFEGIGGALVRAIYHKERSILNPRYCNMCDAAARKFPGGTEVEMSMLFVDVRGSTALSEKMTPTEFSRLINRFYTTASRVITDEDGLVEKLAGDSVAAFWGAGFAGPHYVARTVRVAQRLVKEMTRQNIPVGVGVHSGVGYFGVMGTADGLTEISAVGDQVNMAARVAAQAAAAEILITERALEQSGMDGSQLETRELSLKGISEPVTVRVMHVS